MRTIFDSLPVKRLPVEQLAKKAGRTVLVGGDEETAAWVREFFRRHPKLARYSKVKVNRVLEATGSAGHPEATVQRGIIHLYPKFWALDTEIKDFVFAHEIGHVVESNFDLIHAAEALGVDVWRDREPLPFGQHNMAEAFADSFASYFLDGDVQRRHPDWASLVERALEVVKTATLERSEKERREDERLIQKGTKYKPPRDDLRRKRVKDTDTSERDPDKEQDQKDRSKNYKDATVRVAMLYIARRVALRYKWAKSEREQFLEDMGDRTVRHPETGNEVKITTLYHAKEDKDPKGARLGQKIYFDWVRQKRNKPESDKPESDKPESDKPESDKPESDKPESNKPESNKPESNKPESDGSNIDTLTEQDPDDPMVRFQVPTGPEALIPDAGVDPADIAVEDEDDALEAYSNITKSKMDVKAAENMAETLKKKLLGLPEGSRAHRKAKAAYNALRLYHMARTKPGEEIEGVHQGFANALRAAHAAGMERIFLETASEVGLTEAQTLDEISKKIARVYKTVPQHELHLYLDDNSPLKEVVEKAFKEAHTPAVAKYLRDLLEADLSASFRFGDIAKAEIDQDMSQIHGDVSRITSGQKRLTMESVKSLWEAMAKLWQRMSSKQSASAQRVASRYVRNGIFPINAGY